MVVNNFPGVGRDMIASSARFCGSRVASECAEAEALCAREPVVGTLARGRRWGPPMSDECDELAARTTARGVQCRTRANQ